MENINIIICKECHLTILQEITNNLDLQGWVKCSICGYMEKKEK